VPPERSDRPAAGGRVAAARRALRALWNGDLAAVWPQRRGPRRDPGPVGALRGLYLALAGVVLVSTAVSLRYRDHPLVDQFGAEIATDALGILVTLAVVQRMLERQERARRLRGSMGALRRGRGVLQEMATAWADLIKGALAGEPDPRPGVLEEIFAPGTTEALLDLDLSAALPAGAGGEGTCARWGVGRLLDARAALRDLGATFGATLDPLYLEALDSLADNPFLELVGGLAGAAAPDQREWRVRLSTWRTLRIGHFERLLGAVAMHNELAREAGRLRARATTPRTDMLGIELEPDHDLRVSQDVPTAWWQAEPRPGACSLRRR
jgi:hypothetical protein